MQQFGRPGARPPATSPRGESNGHGLRHEAAPIKAAGPDAGSRPPERPPVDKRFETLRARAALAGFGLYQCAGGDCIVTRWWNLSRVLPDFDSVEQFLARAGTEA